MEFSAQQIADFLKGEVEGDATVKVSQFSKIEEGKPGSLSFLSNPKYEHHLYDTKASVVLVNKTFKPEQPVPATLIKVEDAYQSLATLLTLVERSKPKKQGLDPRAFLSDTSTIGEGCYIGPGAYIGEGVILGKNVMISPNVVIGDGVKIGDDTSIHANATIYEQCEIGCRCILHAGVVIGSDGFGFAPDAEGHYHKIPQIGNVVVEDDVEIGANTTIDRATMGSTHIRRGVKLDNLVQVAHNVEIGEDTVIASQTGVAGSTKLGRSCVVGGQVGFAGHLKIADGSQFGAKSGVAKSIQIPGKPWQGYPIQSVLDFQKSSIVFRDLPRMSRVVSKIEKKIL